MSVFFRHVFWFRQLLGEVAIAFGQTAANHADENRSNRSDVRSFYIDPHNVMQPNAMNDRPLPSQNQHYALKTPFVPLPCRV